MVVTWPIMYKIWCMFDIILDALSSWLASNRLPLYVRCLKYELVFGEVLLISRGIDLLMQILLYMSQFINYSLSVFLTRFNFPLLFGSLFWAPCRVHILIQIGVILQVDLLHPRYRPRKIVINCLLFHSLDALFW